MEYKRMCLPLHFSSVSVTLISLVFASLIVQSIRCQCSQPSANVKQTFADPNPCHERAPCIYFALCFCCAFFMECYEQTSICNHWTCFVEESLTL